MGVYVNSKLIASTNYPGPIPSLKMTVKHTNGVITVDYTDNDISFPPINLTGGDAITVVLYSAVSYTLPTCAVANESEEVELMVEMHVISAKLYEEGRYITEEPVIYVINVTSPISQLPQETNTKSPSQSKTTNHRVCTSI